jgi:hypothetical protein
MLSIKLAWNVYLRTCAKLGNKKKYTYMLYRLFSSSKWFPEHGFQLRPAIADEI